MLIVHYQLSRWIQTKDLRSCDIQQLLKCSHWQLSIYPDSKLAIGPTIENGFYYDFHTEDSISTEDLPRIEEEMRKSLKRNQKLGSVS